GLRHEAPSDLVSRLAHHLDLPGADLTLGSAAGRRVVYGCSGALRPVLNPDGSSVTFGAKADLVRHWGVAVRLALACDRRGGGAGALERRRRGDGGAAATVVTLPLPRAVNPVAAGDPDRDHTELVFLDAFDPKPAPGVPLSEPHLTYTLVPRFAAAGTDADP